MQSIMSIRPPETLRKKLKALAKERGITINALVISIFWDYLKKRSK